MRQRLALGTALLHDPQVLILDEPANGLDPEGVRWLRDLLHGLAAEGRTVLVSSHILDHGHLVAQAALDELTGRAAQVVRIRTPKPEALQVALAGTGAASTIVAPDQVEVSGATPSGSGSWRPSVRSRSSRPAPRPVGNQKPGRVL